jgi:hypothetical protein
MAYPVQAPLTHRFVTVEIPDVSTAGQRYVVPGFRGKIKNAYSALNGAIATADATLTLKIGGTAVTGGTITIANSGSAAGDVDSCTPSAANLFQATDAIEVETDGASTNAVAAVVTLELEGT